jgi:hypothetical protein
VRYTYKLKAMVITNIKANILKIISYHLLPKSKIAITIENNNVVIIKAAPGTFFGS